MVEVKPGVIPRQALAVLAKGFGRKTWTDEWVEDIARMFLEAWPDARVKNSGYGSNLILPTQPLRAIEDGADEESNWGDS